MNNKLQILSRPEPYNDYFVSEIKAGRIVAKYLNKQQADALLNAPEEQKKKIAKELNGKVKDIF
jgi:hypothetical protein